jgi:hypothetical protein
VKRRVLDAVSTPIVPEQGLVVNSLTARTAAPGLLGEGAAMFLLTRAGTRPVLTPVSGMI